MEVVETGEEEMAVDAMSLRTTLLPFEISPQHDKMSVSQIGSVFLDL